jgi:selenocysteine lyase/cysteine desulfurase
MAAARRYETDLVRQLLERVSTIPGLRVRGITDPAQLAERCPTIAFTLEGHHPRAVASFLGQRGIHVWDGDYYAWELIRALGLAEEGGMVRVGLVHYNEAGEVERLARALEELVAGRT